MESEGVAFERRLGTVLRVIEKEIDPENFTNVSYLLGSKTLAYLLFKVKIKVSYLP